LCANLHRRDGLGITDGRNGYRHRLTGDVRRDNWDRTARATPAPGSTAASRAGTAATASRRLPSRLLRIGFRILRTC
jgi:hypothetical protein